MATWRTAVCVKWREASSRSSCSSRSDLSKLIFSSERSYINTRVLIKKKKPERCKYKEEDIDFCFEYMDDVIQKSTTTANTAIIRLPGVYLGHCTVSFSIYGFRWLMWYLQTFILNVFCMFRSLDSNKMLGYSTEFAWKKKFLSFSLRTKYIWKWFEY